jgi:cytochrome c553
MINHLLAGTVSLVACLVAMPSFSDDAVKPSDPAQVSKTVTGACQDCHGEKGDSSAPTFPRLNGQQSDYISAQLKAFRDHSRGDPHAQAYMWGMASSLDDALIAGLAKYYAGQPPTLPQSGGALAAEGKKIFAEGVEKDHIPPCQACHGEHGEGDGTTPRLAGQHADYLIKQLEAFRSLLRQNDVMHANTKEMTDSQIAAIVSYLAND